jgi:hypothetical protein
MRYMKINLIREISGQGNSGKRTPESKNPGEKVSGGGFR